MDTAVDRAEFLICPLSDDGETINRCIAIEDYKIMNVLEVEAREPVTERKREQATSDEAKTRQALSTLVNDDMEAATCDPVSG